MSTRFVLFGLLLVLAVNAVKVPSYLHICGRRNPRLDDCVKESVLFIRPQLRKGMPDMEIPPLDPMDIDNIKLIDMNNFQASTHNVKLYGLSDFEIKSLHLDLDKMRIDLVAFFPKLDLDATYNVNARILVPVSGKGPIKLSAMNVTATVTGNFKLVEKNGYQYWFFTAMTTKLDIKDYTADFEGANEAELNPTLLMAINQVMGTSHQEVLDAVRPTLEKTVSQQVLVLCNKISKHFPYEVMLPDRE